MPQPPSFSLGDSAQRVSVIIFFCLSDAAVPSLRVCKQHILSKSLSPEIGKIAANRASGIKIIWGAWLDLLSLSSVWLL